MHLGASGSSTSSCFANTRPSLAVATVRNARAECSRRHRAGCRSSSRTGGLVFFAVVVSNRFFCFGAKAGVRARLPIAVSRSGQIYLFDLARHFCNLSLSPSHPLSLQLFTVLANVLAAVAAAMKPTAAFCCQRLLRQHTMHRVAFQLRVSVAVLLELTELAEPVERPCLCCNTQCTDGMHRSRRNHGVS